MGTGQMLLTIMALVLFGTTIITVNHNSLTQGTILRQTELGIYAVSLATSYIQRASELDFDSSTVGGLVYINVPMPQPPYIPAGVLTAPSHLGPDKNNTANVDTSYDDFDDYNGFVRDTNFTDVAKFHVTASVYYINQTGANQFQKTTANTTWLKRMDINVNDAIDRGVYSGETAGTDTIKMSYILSFYK
jgi:hypothetical protein